MSSLAAVSLLFLTCFSRTMYSQCEASAPVRQILQKLQTDDLRKSDRVSERNKILDLSLAEHPEDYFLLAARLQSVERSSDMRLDHANLGLEWAKAQRDKYDRPIYTLLYAKALAGTNTPESIRLLESLETAHPELTRAHLELISAGSFGKFKDKAREQRELDEFFKACPAPLSGSALQTLARTGTREQMARTAEALRKRLQADPDTAKFQAEWSALWSLEFKSHPPAEHPAVRKQVAEDLAHFEQAGRHDVRWMVFLREGYESVGDKAAVDRINDAIVKDYPASDEAKETVQDRWRKKYPYPKEKDQLEAYERASLEAGQEWHKRWPDDSLILDRIFGALTELPDTTAKQVETAADQLLAAYRKNPNWYGFPPVELQVAEVLVKRKIHLDQVPGLVEEGYRSSEARNRRQLRDDRYPDDLRGQFEDSNVSLRLERARVLLDYYAAVKQSEKAAEVAAELAMLNPSKPYLKTSLLARRAQAAEVQGRKLDALMLYRAAVEARGATPVSPMAKDTPEENLDRLWKELGGTSAGYALLMDKPKGDAATDSRWERPKNPLPAFAVSDLQGKTWKLANLEGKAVLINIWATWCGPCREEHPEFQKLYDKLKTRPDVAVLSFNVDDDLGKVEPYMKENKYTFPVLLGKEVVDTVVPALAIPRNWFVNTKGKLEWEQVGYGGDPKWPQTMEGKLDEVLKGIQ